MNSAKTERGPSLVFSHYILYCSYSVLIHTIYTHRFLNVLLNRRLRLLFCRCRATLWKYCNKSIIIIIITIIIIILVQIQFKNVNHCLLFQYFFSICPSLGGARHFKRRKECKFVTKGTKGSISTFEKNIFLLSA